MLNNFFKKQKEIKKTSDEERLKKANFEEEEGVPCLFNKVLQRIKDDFYNCGAYGDCDYKIYDFFQIVDNKSINKTITVNISREHHTPIFSGQIIIKGTEFKINHNSCVTFINCLKETEKQRETVDKQKILKEWGCEL